MRIAIADDEKRELTRLRELALRCAEKAGLPLTCDCFSGGLELLQASEQTYYDAVLLDVYMIDSILVESSSHRSRSLTLTRPMSFRPCVT